MILYAIVVEASIIEMFQAALLPGLVAVSFFIVVILIKVRLNPALAPVGKSLSKKEKREAIIKLLPVILTFGSIILGLGLGLFTPTPAASAGVFIIMVYGLYLRMTRGADEGLTLQRLKNSLSQTATYSAMIYFILFGAEVLKGFFTRSGLPQMMSQWALDSGLDPWIILAAILIFLIVLGCFMDSIAMILIIIPFIWPVLITINGGEYVLASDAAFGMGLNDLKIWFGILALIVVELGLITPPVGLNVFIISKIAQNVSMLETFKGVIPFFVAELFRIALLMLLPSLALIIPHWLSG